MTRACLLACLLVCACAPAPTPAPVSHCATTTISEVCTQLEKLGCPEAEIRTECLAQLAFIVSRRDLYEIDLACICEASTILELHACESIVCEAI